MRATFVYPLSLWRAETPATVLGYGQLHESAIETAVERLAAALRDLG